MIAASCEISHGPWLAASRLGRRSGRFGQEEGERYAGAAFVLDGQLQPPAGLLETTDIGEAADPVVELVEEAASCSIGFEDACELGVTPQARPAQFNPADYLAASFVERLRALERQRKRPRVHVSGAKRERLVQELAQKTSAPLFTRRGRAALPGQEHDSRRD